MTPKALFALTKMVSNYRFLNVFVHFWNKHVNSSLDENYNHDYIIKKVRKIKQWKNF